MAGVDVAGYLARLGLDRSAVGTAPSVAALRLLHRAHVERVPYETLEFQLGRATTVDPQESATRVIAGRGGYCFLLNGAFSLLLTALGYKVLWHSGGVQGRDDREPVGANGSHLVLSVHALHAADCPQGAWLVDGWRLDHDDRGSFLGMDFTMTPASPEAFVTMQHRVGTPHVPTRSHHMTMSMHWWQLAGPT